MTTDPTSGVSFFAGAVDDPFFLDNTAANRFVLDIIQSLENFGTNDEFIEQILAAAVDRGDILRLKRIRRRSFRTVAGWKTM